MSCACYYKVKVQIAVFVHFRFTAHLLAVRRKVDIYALSTGPIERRLICGRLLEPFHMLILFIERQTDALTRARH